MLNMETGKKEYTFLWFIENYSYCWHKKGEQLVSPEFTLDSLEGTVWKLSLHPRGEKDEHKGNISLFLCRSKNDAGPENVSVDYELSFLASDGSSLISKEFEYTFEKSNGRGRGKFLMMDEVLSCRKAEYLPQDTLSVRCKIWKGEGKIQPVAQIYARTRIGIEQISFLLVTENFGALTPNHTETSEIRFPSKKGLNLSCSLCISECPCCDEKVVVELSPSDSKYILFKCKFSLLDAAGKKIECGEIDNRLDATRNTIRKLPLTLTKQVILENKNKYLPDDKLSVSCQCIFATGEVEYEKIENTVYDVTENEKPVMLVNQLNINDVNDDIYAEQPSTCPSALDDLKAIYNDKFLTDMELRTKTKSFSVHKIVCARSTVFKAMLTNDMKEKHTDCIQIDDLEDNVVDQLLLFLYCDVLENLNWESAIKLYYAGDKYTINKLKHLCSSFLVKNLSASNVSAVLLLADTHNDDCLKKAVEDFILNHEEQVFRSDEWKSLIKTNSVLVSETMCLKYTRK